MTELEPYRCGYVAIVGRSNVGKSTLLNRLLGQKISITSPKPQTTRHRILGIKTLVTKTGAGQILYVDTPGLHLGDRHAMNRYMNRVTSQVLADVDAVILMSEGVRWTSEDQQVLEKVQQSGRPAILAINKVDKLDDKRALLPHIEAIAHKADFRHIVPISAQYGDNVSDLESCVLELLPQSSPLFPEDQVTDRSERFLAAELVREKLMLHLQQEIPYATTVEIEAFSEEPSLNRVSAVIWVERQGQKAIVIGKHGAQLKTVGREAREDMEKMFGKKVFLQLWVKVREGWSDDERALQSLGYDSEI